MTMYSNSCQFVLSILKTCNKVFKTVKTDQNPFTFYLLPFLPFKIRLQLSKPVTKPVEPLKPFKKPLKPFKNPLKPFKTLLQLFRQQMIDCPFTVNEPPASVFS